MIAARRRRKDRADAQRVLRETRGQLSCFQIRAHAFVWKWGVWGGLSSILANLEQDNGVITVTLWMIYMHIGSLSVAWKPYISRVLLRLILISTRDRLLR